MRVFARLFALVLVSATTSCALCMRYEPIPVLSREDLPVREGSHLVGLLDSGWEALAVRIHLIRSARSSIDLQTFIWTDDEVGSLLVYEVIQAARRGVSVRLLVDQMFSAGDPELVAFVATAHPNLALKFHNPNVDRISASSLAMISETIVNFGQVNQRAHDKMMVVDGRTALIGGRNLENTYFDYARGMNYKDREIIVEGPVVQDIAQAFERYWRYERCLPSAELLDVEPLIRSGSHVRLETAEDFAVSDLLRELEPRTSPKSIFTLLERTLQSVDGVAFICDEPGKPTAIGDEVPPYPVTRVLGGLVRGARESVLLQSPYLVLSDRAVRLFKDLRQEYPDVSVRVSTNSLAATDSWPTYAMSYRQKRVMLEELGFRIFEFKPRPADLMDYLTGHDRAEAGSHTEPSLCLHSKSLVLDGEIAAIGSFNLDPRSSHTNTEVMLLVFDRDFAARLARSIESDAHPRNSWTVWKRERPLVVSQLDDLLHSLSRVVAAITTVDLWPSRFASSFELIDDREAVPPGDPDFYDNYRAVGHFPEVEIADEKLILTRLFKAFGKPVDWLL